MWIKTDFVSDFVQFLHDAIDLSSRNLFLKLFCLFLGQSQAVQYLTTDEIATRLPNRLAMQSKKSKHVCMGNIFYLL